ncbi:unnamed protein product [Candidula unifasciata]|uniref:Replication stress response regulator SDE2 n=1 Tax=Candidula unifasciata TaxID=100452 RepID=A0A8S3ZD67_9EUPU|nr:unnamed protein product [Candidula unifasciata]
MLVHIVHCSLYVTREIQDESVNVDDLFSYISIKNVDRSSVFTLCNGRKVAADDKLENGKTYHIVPRLPGGKGGFGSMLRAIGAQIEKTTSREACRDLSGRRMRDINNEKKLKDWLAKEAERESEREQRRQERQAKRLAQNPHKFDDAVYHEQRAKVQEDLQDALSKGLKRTHKKAKGHDCADKKIKLASASGSISKTEWIGVDIDSSSSSDGEASPGDADPGDADADISQSSCSRDYSAGDGGSSSSTLESSDNGKDSDLVERRLGVEGLDQTSTRDCGADTSEIKVSEQTLSMDTGCIEGSEVSIDKQKQNLIVSNDNSEPTNNDEPVDLDRYDSKDELASLGMERLKNALMTRGLKCGGTLEERAERLFSVKGLSSDEIDPSLYAKGKGKGKKSK